MNEGMREYFVIIEIATAFKTAGIRNETLNKIIKPG